MSKADASATRPLSATSPVRKSEPRIHASRAATVSAGMMYEFTRPQECRFRDHLVDVHIYSYRIQDWAKDAPGLVEIGREFHDMLHAAADRLGVTDQPHEDDENHNRYVGVTIEMIKHGLPVKGLSFYNRWAAVSRHPLVRLLTAKKVVVEIDHGLRVSWDGERFEVTRP